MSMWPLLIPLYIITAIILIFLGWCVYDIEREEKKKQGK